MYLSGLISHREALVLVSGRACHLRFLVFQGDLLVSFKACSHGAAISETTQSGPQHGVAFVNFLLQYNILNSL